MGKKRAQYIISNSLYLVIAGSDDLANTYFSTGVGRLEYDIVSYTNLMVDSAFNFIKVLCTCACVLWLIKDFQLIYGFLEWNYMCRFTNYFRFLIKELLKLEARRIAIFGAPPLGCLPSQRTLAGGALRVCARDRNEASQLYNSKLSTKLDLFAKRLPYSTRVVYLDIYHPLLDIIQHPRKYGNCITIHRSSFICIS